MTRVPVAVIVGFAAFQLTMCVVARRRWRHPAGDVPDLLYVFVLPCRDEELVIGQCLDRLRALPDPNWLAIVVDDASVDGTAALVAAHARQDRRIRVLARRLPDARQGKGAALNAAYRSLGAGTVHGYPPERVILVVLDADGRIESHALAAVAPYFADPRVGGAQVAVRIRNAPDAALPRLQDIEFVAYTEIFQRARRWWGTAGLGGNGQFTRLSALRTLGGRPWSDCLTEDLDLGIRLVTAGWRTVYAPETYVSQQGVHRLGPLLRQRTRWFQGTLQCFTRIPAVVESRQASPRRATDVVVHLTLPLLLLSMTFPTVAFWVIVASETASTPPEALAGRAADHAVQMVVMYAIAFGPGWLYGTLYRHAGGSASWVRALVWGHLFVLYAYLWIPAGWWAVARTVAGRAGWAKTLRVGEPAPASRES